MAAQVRFQERMSAVQEFFRINPHVSETLHTKTLNYTAAMWTLHRGIDHQAVLAELPLAVKQEVMTSLHKYRVVAQRGSSSGRGFHC